MTSFCLKLFTNSQWISRSFSLTRTKWVNLCHEHSHQSKLQCQLTSFLSPSVQLQQPSCKFFNESRLNSKDHAKGSTQRFAAVQKPVEIQVVGTQGEALGPMSRRRAEQLAREKNLKLAVIDAGSHPLPTWQLLTMQEYALKQQQLRHSKQAAAVTARQPVMKMAKVSASITPHDLNTKVSHAIEWLQKGHLVKFVISSAKDEKGAEATFSSIVAATKDASTVQQATRTSSDITFQLMPKCGTMKASSPGDSSSSIDESATAKTVDKKTIQKPFKLEELRKLQAAAAEIDDKKDTV